MLQKCVDRHTDCRCSLSSSRGSSRLIDSCASPLRIADKESCQSKYYATLSYCWGSGEHKHAFRKRNLEEYYQHVPGKHMPATLKDTMLLVWCLGIRYLRIDALCIIQDDEEDWTIESQQMIATYSSALLCISALFGTSSNAGLFRDRLYAMEIDPLHKAGIEYLPQPNPSFSIFKSSRLNQRAWTLQERLLSPRLLHIGDCDIWFECRESLICFKDRVASRGRSTGTFLGLDKFGSIISEISEDSVSSESRILDSWYCLLVEYCSREYTMETDRLVAIDGIRNLYQPYMKCNYIFGLWEHDFYNGSLWFNGGCNDSDMSSCLIDPLSVPLFDRKPLGSRYFSGHSSKILTKLMCRSLDRRREIKEEHSNCKWYQQEVQTHWIKIIPSWSWASVSCPINFCYVNSQKYFTFSGRTFQRLRMDVKKLTYLTIQGSLTPCLEILGAIANITFDLPTWISHIDYPTQSLRSLTNPVKVKSQVFLDREIHKRDLERGRQCHGLLVYKSGFTAKDLCRSHCTLLLLKNELRSQKSSEERTYSERRMFRRIGVAFIETVYSELPKGSNKMMELMETFYLV